MLALRTLVTGSARATEVGLEIITGRSVVAGIAGTCVGLILAVGTPVALPAVTGVGSACISTPTTVSAEPRHGGAAVVGGDLAGHHLHIAHFPSPAGSTGAVEGGSVLTTDRPILAGGAGAPVDQLFAVCCAGESRGAVALVVATHVLAGAPVLAGVAVAGVDSGLAVAAGEPGLAPAGVSVDAVNADTAIHAGAGRTILVVCLACCARKTYKK